jgi:hypothetical protein
LILKDLSLIEPQDSQKSISKFGGDALFCTFALGELAEWSIAAVLKTVDCNRSGGSNPSLSAEKLEYISMTLLSLKRLIKALSITMKLFCFQSISLLSTKTEYLRLA